MIVPGSGSSRGDLDREIAQERELSQVEVIDRGAGGLTTPTPGGAWSRQGRMVRLPDFNVPGSGAIIVDQSIHVALPQATTTTNPPTAASAQVLRYTVPASYGMRVTGIYSYPCDPGAAPFYATTVSIDGESIPGMVAATVTGNTVLDDKPVSFLVPGGRTLIFTIDSYLLGNQMVVVGFRGYLYAESGAK